MPFITTLIESYTYNEDGQTGKYQGCGKGWMGVKGNCKRAPKGTYKRSSEFPATRGYDPKKLEEVRKYDLAAIKAKAKADKGKRLGYSGTKTLMNKTKAEAEANRKAGITPSVNQTAAAEKLLKGKSREELQKIVDSGKGDRGYRKLAREMLIEENGKLVDQRLRQSGYDPNNSPAKKRGRKKAATAEPAAAKTTSGDKPKLTAVQGGKKGKGVGRKKALKDMSLPELYAEADRIGSKYQDKTAPASLDERRKAKKEANKIVDEAGVGAAVAKSKGRKGLGVIEGGKKEERKPKGQRMLDRTEEAGKATQAAEAKLTESKAKAGQYKPEDFIEKTKLGDRAVAPSRAELKQQFKGVSIAEHNPDMITGLGGSKNPKGEAKEIANRMNYLRSSPSDMGIPFEAKQLREKPKIRNQAEFEQAINEAIKVLKEPEDLASIWKIRRTLGGRISRADFDDYMARMVEGDKILFREGTNADVDPYKMLDSIATRVSGPRTYIAKIK